MSKLDPALPTAVLPPRLSILHLMLLTFCVAVALTFIRSVNRNAENLPGEIMGIYWASAVIFSVTTGAAIGGTLVLGLHAVRIRRMPAWQPGHWLVIVTGVTTVLTIATQNVLEWTEDNSEVVNVARVSIALLECLAFSAVAIAYWGQQRWHAFFWGLAILNGLQTVFHAVLAFDPEPEHLPWTLNSISQYGMGLLPFWLIVVCIRDRLVGSRRDWLHWLGVALVFSWGIQMAIWTVGLRLLQGF